METRSPLKRKTELSGKTKLKVYTGLKTSSVLKSKARMKKKTFLFSDTPLRAHKKLQAHKGLQTEKSLQTESRLQAKTPLQAKTALNKSDKPIAVKQKTAKKLKREYRSVFGPAGVCAVTGEKEHIVPHHIFSGPYKKASEEYGFILFLRRDWHTGQIYSIHEDREFDLRIKRKCEEYYLSLGRSREDFIREFGQWY